jgi:hypothetical protein
MKKISKIIESLFDDSSVDSIAKDFDDNRLLIDCFLRPKFIGDFNKQKKLIDDFVTSITKEYESIVSTEFFFEYDDKKAITCLRHEFEHFAKRYYKNVNQFAVIYYEKQLHDEIIDFTLYDIDKKRRTGIIIYKDYDKFRIDKYPVNIDSTFNHIDSVNGIILKIPKELFGTWLECFESLRPEKNWDEGKFSEDK